jgi:hypothetical protein
MYAGLDLDLGLGSHAGKGTRHGPKSLLFQIDGEQSTSRKNTWRAIQSNSVCASELIIF